MALGGRLGGGYSVDLAVIWLTILGTRTHGPGFVF